MTSTPTTSAGYGYDAESRLVTSTGALGSAAYVYDAEGRRVRKSVGATVTDYLYDAAGNVADEMNSVNGGSTWAWGRSYIYAASGLLAEYENNTTYFIHKDHLGSTRLVTGVGASVCESDDYLPFGEQIAGGACTTHKFTGKERDAESGLDNFGARYDSSSLGRFMSPDKVVTIRAVLNPQRLNRYAYVINNPLGLLDPNGNEDIYFIFQRDPGTNKSTTGTIYVHTSNGKNLQGKFLEPPEKPDKLHPKGRIPAGEYAATPLEHMRSKPAVPALFELQDVKGFTHIEAHVGNTPEDTRACFLVGTKLNNDEVKYSTVFRNAAWQFMADVASSLGIPTKDLDVHVSVLDVQYDTKPTPPLPPDYGGSSGSNPGGTQSSVAIPSGHPTPEEINSILYGFRGESQPML